MKAFRYTIEEKGKTKVLTSTGQQQGATFGIRHRDDPIEDISIRIRRREKYKKPIKD